MSGDRILTEEEKERGRRSLKAMRVLAAAVDEPGMEPWAQSLIEEAGLKAAKDIVDVCGPEE